MNPQILALIEAANQIRRMSTPDMATGLSMLDKLIAEGPSGYGPMQASAQVAIAPYPNAETYAMARLEINSPERGSDANVSRQTDYDDVRRFLDRLPK